MEILGQLSVEINSQAPRSPRSNFVGLIDDAICLSASDECDDRHDTAYDRERKSTDHLAP